MNNISSIPDPIVLNIGRTPDNDIQLPKSNISQKQATLMICSPNSYVLEHIGKTHPTSVLVENMKVGIKRKIIGPEDTVFFADNEYQVADILPARYQPLIFQENRTPKANPLDFTVEFAALREIYEQFPQMQQACRDREKTVRLWSTLLGTTIGISSFATGGAIALLSLASSAGLSILLPTLASALLTTDEKLRLLEKEYNDQYRCPNQSSCVYRFGRMPWADLAFQKKCPRCKAIWVA